MSLWQNLVSSYENNYEKLNKIYPLSSTSISNKMNWLAVITINDSGDFIKASKIEKHKKFQSEAYVINLPVSEGSLARTGQPEPHPIFDNFDFLNPESSKHEYYYNLLEDFAKSKYATSEIKSVFSYINKKRIHEDLAFLKPEQKTNVLFEIERFGVPTIKLWEEPSLFQSWHEYYVNVVKLKDNSRIDEITGKTQSISRFHPKKLSNISANAKLISANDTSNFTFRGRFEIPHDASSVGYESSQKAHQFLRYLIADRGISCGEQIIITFSVNSLENNFISPIFNNNSLSDFLESIELENMETDMKLALQANTGFNYHKALNNALLGGRYNEILQKHPKTCILVLDNATTGRMAITFYRELNSREYLEKIKQWHDTCSWYHSFRIARSESIATFIGAPFTDRIIEAVYGFPSSNNDAGHIKIKKFARERLLRCVFDGISLPADFTQAAIRRTSNPLAVTEDDKFNRWKFNQLLSTTCSLIRKEFLQNYNKEFKLTLEADRNDRDYLYGRLLGAADKLEEYALFKDKKERIITASIRHMQSFSQHPFRTWQTIHDTLIPYIQKVKGSFAFQAIEEIKNLFQVGDFENNKPLNGSYLIGYYHQRKHIELLISQASDSKNSNSFKNNLLENNDD